MYLYETEAVFFARTPEELLAELRVYRQKVVSTKVGLDLAIV